MAFGQGWWHISFVGLDMRILHISSNVDLFFVLFPRNRTWRKVSISCTVYWALARTSRWRNSILSARALAKINLLCFLPESSAFSWSVVREAWCRLGCEALATRCWTRWLTHLYEILILLRWFGSLLLLFTLLEIEIGSLLLWLTSVGWWGRWSCGNLFVSRDLR